MVQAVLGAITEKGWNLYYNKTLGVKLDKLETIQRGPVDSLGPGIMYIILPMVANPTDEEEIDAFLKKHQEVEPKITVPQIPGYLGRAVDQFDGGDEEEYFLHPGTEISFIGIELQEKEIRLLSPTKTFMLPDVFLSALDSLQDIRKLS